MVELLTVLKERTLKLCNASPRPGNDDFTGWLPVVPRASAINLLLLVPTWALREGSGGPCIHRLAIASFVEFVSNSFISFTGADRV